jgi:uncharacterized protein (DUF433 family)
MKAGNDSWTKWSAKRIPMTTKTLDQYIERSLEIRSGKPHIAGRRITVSDVMIRHEWMGHSADEIATDYDLTLAEIYAALAYYYDNRSEIDESIQASQEFARQLQKTIASKLPS